MQRKNRGQKEANHPQVSPPLHLSPHSLPPQLSVKNKKGEKREKKIM